MMWRGVLTEARGELAQTPEGLWTQTVDSCWDCPVGNTLHCPTCSPRGWACTLEGPALALLQGEGRLKPKKTCPTGAHTCPRPSLGTEAPRNLWANKSHSGSRGLFSGVSSHSGSKHDANSDTSPITWGHAIPLLLNVGLNPLLLTHRELGSAACDLQGQVPKGTRLLPAAPWILRAPPLEL